jgi:hypothetical protein
MPYTAHYGRVPFEKRQQKPKEWLQRAREPVLDALTPGRP